MSATKNIKSIMEEACSIIQVDMLVDDAIKLLISHKCPTAFVCDHDGKMVGVFSAHDAFRTYLDYAYFEMGRAFVGDFMNTEIVTLGESDNLFEAAHKFIESRSKTLPVVSDGKILGQITRQSLLEALNQDWAQKAHEFRHGQQPMIGKWAKRFVSEGGSALPDGFNNQIISKKNSK